MLNYQNISTDDLMRLALEAKCHSRTVRRWVRGENVHRVTDNALSQAAQRLKLEIERGTEDTEPPPDGDTLPSAEGGT